jgi:hypothetical protein
MNMLRKKKLYITRVYKKYLVYGQSQCDECCQIRVFQVDIFKIQLNKINKKKGF